VMEGNELRMRRDGVWEELPRFKRDEIAKVFEE
jgi:hypothetical protein